MPVIECACGMVMSVPAAGPRGGCIRCGGVDFHVLDWRAIDPARRATFCRPPLVETAPLAAVFAGMAASSGAAAGSDTIGCEHGTEPDKNKNQSRLLAIPLPDRAD